MGSQSTGSTPQFPEGVEKAGTASSLDTCFYEKKIFWQIFSWPVLKLCFYWTGWGERNLTMCFLTLYNQSVCVKGMMIGSYFLFFSHLNSGQERDLEFIHLFYHF